MAIEQEKLRWENEVSPADQTLSRRKESFATSSGIEIPPILLPPEKQDYMEDLGFPGGIRIRGVQPTISWSILDHAAMRGYATAENRSTLPLFVGPGADRPVCGFRPADTNWL